ncbi:MAG TPA: hypothetical protein PL181_12115 [bacterium]|nr:hypothetical protein [bacterium]
MAILEALLLFLGAKFASPLIALAAVAMLFFVPWVLVSTERTLYCLMAYISVLPSYAAYLRYPYLKYYVNLAMVAAVVLFMFGHQFIRRLMQDGDALKRSSRLDRALLLFLSWVLFSALWGFFMGGSVKYLLIEAYFFSLYLCYFIVSDNFDDYQLRRMWDFLALVTVFVSFEYIYIALKEAGLGALLIKRVSTQQPHLAQLAIPYLASFMLFGKPSRLIKLLSIAAIMPMALMVFFSQQRALWGAVFVSLVVLWAFRSMQQGFSMRTLRRFSGYILTTLVILIFMVWMADKMIMGSSIFTILWRFSSLLDIANDESLAIRMGEISHAMQQWQNHRFLGTGLGSTISPVTLIHYSNNNVDNSYAVILWKTGIIGLALYLSVLALVFKHGLYVFRCTKSIERQRMIAALLSGFTGLLVIALTNACLAFYIYSIIWAAGFASVEILYRLEQSNQINGPIERY